jgi:hypothetical protein
MRVDEAIAGLGVRSASPDVLCLTTSQRPPPTITSKAGKHGRSMNASTASNSNPNSIYNTEYLHH